MLVRHDAQARSDAITLYRRLAFNMLVSKLSNSLRNHDIVCPGAEAFIAALGRRRASGPKLGQESSEDLNPAHRAE
jgi:hypothetical protein